MSYFQNYTERFFFLYGETKDEFYTSELKVQNLEQLLHEHLKNEAYERIVFYQGQAKGVRCYDQHSFKLTFSKKESPSNKKKASKNNPVLAGILGQRISKKSKKEKSQQNNSLSLSKKMQDVDIVNHFHTLLEENEIKTALVFSDFNDFLTHTEKNVIRNLNTKINDWEGLSSHNQNIVIFIIPPDIPLQSLRRNTNWEGLTSKMFVDPGADDFTTSEQMIQINIPHIDEIRNLINYYRIMKDLEVEWSEFYENINTLLKITKERNIDLKKLSSKIRPLKRFTSEGINNIFNLKKEKTGLKRLKEMSGLEYLVSEIEKLVIYANRSKKTPEILVMKSNEVQRICPQVKCQHKDVNLHIALSGNPGTGKTTVAKIIAEIFKENDILEIGHIIEATSSDLIGEHVGHTAIKTQEVIERALGGVLFIDEAYKLLSNDFGAEAIDTLVESMTAYTGEISIIIAGYPTEIKDFISSNPGLERRFANNIRLKDYEPPILQEIFEKKMQLNNFTFSPELNEVFPYFLQNWFDARDEDTFGNAGAVLNLQERMSKNAFYQKRTKFILDDIPQEYKRHAKVRSEDSMETALKELDDIVGLESVKENIESIVRGIEMSRLRGNTQGVSAGHYIFKGNPGTGKTTVARILGTILKELKVLKKGHFTEVTREDLVGGYVGQTATKTKEVLKASLGGVLFIDEAYSLSKGGENDFGKEAIDTIVPFMENHLSDFTLIVAGYDQDMEKFLDSNTGLKSRFSHTIEFLDYSENEMLKIFKIYLKEPGFNLENGVETRLLSIFNSYKAQSKHFGNGRDARKIFNQIRANMDKRLSTYNDLVEQDERLFLITLQDLKDGFEETEPTLEDVLDGC